MDVIKRLLFIFAIITHQNLLCGYLKYKLQTIQWHMHTSVSLISPLYFNLSEPEKREVVGIWWEKDGKNTLSETLNSANAYFLYGAVIGHYNGKVLTGIYSKMSHILTRFEDKWPKAVGSARKFFTGSSLSRDLSMKVIGKAVTTKLVGKALLVGVGLVAAYVNKARSEETKK